MDIIIAGVGKIGQTLARQLTAEGHDLTLIDTNAAVLQTVTEQCDAVGVVGNCATMEVLEQARLSETELVIAATESDEVNLLCAMTAHGIHKEVHTIARIRDPQYAGQVHALPEVFPLSMTVNPEGRAALEIERLLKYPGFLRRDSFAKGRAEIVELRIDESSKLKDVSLSQMNSVMKCRVLVCAVLRAGNAVTPGGDFVLRSGDRIFVTASREDLTAMLKNLGIIPKKARKVLLCGGGKVSYYLAKFLEDDRVDVTIMEKDPKRCVELAKALPHTAVIQGDCANYATLDSQNIAGCDAVVTLTGSDETNMIVSLYAANRGVGQTITKISHDRNVTIADTLALGSLVCPRELCSNDIVRYVRAMENQSGAAVSVHTIADAQVEAVEFLVEETTRNCGVPLKAMKLRKDILIAGIISGGKPQIPGGDSVFMPGDHVIVVTSSLGALQTMNDIFA